LLQENAPILVRLVQLKIFYKALSIIYLLIHDSEKSCNFFFDFGKAIVKTK